MNDFFTKNRVKTALRVGVSEILFRKGHYPKCPSGRKPVFDQTFVKSLRVRNALRVGVSEILFREWKCCVE